MCKKTFGVKSIIHFCPRVKQLIPYNYHNNTLVAFPFQMIHFLVGTLIAENKVKSKLLQILKMISEVIFLYIIRAIITILGILEAKIMLKYFNQKALGMQTIFDQMIKDKLYLSLLTCTCIIIIDIILEISESVNEIIATRIIFLFQLCVLMELWQSIVINAIRSQCSKI